MGRVSSTVCSAAFLVELATARWTSLDGSGNRSDEEARNLPLIGTCGDSRRFVEKAYMVHASNSDASMLMISAVQSSTPRTIETTVEAYVEEAMEQCEICVGWNALGKS